MTLYSVAEISRRRPRRETGVAINIAVIGRSGVGKSSFINAIRGLTADDAEAAPVGVRDVTTQITSYTHPDHPDITFWDVPGLGTDYFPQTKYLRLINVGRYDFFVIMSANRFCETDTWLVNEISRRGKEFAFVRTKVDEEVRNNRKAHPGSHSSEAVVEEIRASTIEHLNHTRQTSADVFLIDSYATHKHDFERLAGRLLDVLPESKNSATTNRQCILS